MGARPKSLSLYQAYLQSLDWLFPPRCANCGRLGSHWCDACQAKVIPLQGNLCPRCGFPKGQDEPCVDCQRHRPAFDEARAWARYNAALRPVVVGLKYRPNHGLSWLLAHKLAAHPALAAWQVAGIIPVPLAAARLRERGHNQAETLARPLARLLGLPLRVEFLRRRRDTPKQVGLSPSERRQNMSDAFVAETVQLQDKNWLVLDDVMTTGATLDAAAAALKAAGAARVYALTLGRATL